MLDKLNISNLGPNSSEKIHLEAEVAKLAYNSRDVMIADPKFYDLNYKGNILEKIPLSLLHKLMFFSLNYFSLNPFIFACGDLN